MKKIIYIAILFSGLANAQITPEFEIGAKGVFSGNLNLNSDESSAVSDFSDTQLLMGLRQKLYNNWRAQFVLGLQFPDANSNLGEVFYNNIFIRLEDQKNIVKLGRTLAKTNLNQFPTLRDDDAQQFTYALNPFSDGVNTERDQYANVLEYSHIFKQRLYVSLHGENFYDSMVPDDFRLNSIGASLMYKVPLSQRWNRNVIQEIGISYNNYFTDRLGYSNDFDASVKNLLFSTTLNLKPDPINFIDFRLQAIQNFGWKEVVTLNEYFDYTRTESTTVFGTFRFLKQKLERPNYQISIGGGYKSLPNLEVDSNQLIIIANSFYRIGESFDIGLQYRYTENTGFTESLFGKNEHRIQLAIVYSFSKIFNKQFGDREDLLNLEHNYLR
ncbi:hypothetical protein [Flavobacterium frigoris]|jgi:hypothetical protein|uniref:Uncharacterized protein n=1 Tax=Flavobacterium frigoris (strain PS1) TaxID=1086011 RepID=H7FWI5_FLAFP|nr:hypothetical protein [Flavobacterium frigoris]EIA07123.1 hypothetical protein HJ01_03532 [Flavobacterium frigoris PS1]